MTTITKELENALARFQGYNEAYVECELTRNFNFLRSRAEELSQMYDFIRFETTHESNFALNLCLGEHVKGRIHVANDPLVEKLIFSISNPLTRKNYTVRTEKSPEKMLITTSKKSDNPYQLKEMYVNKAYLDYLITKVTEHLNNEIQGTEA